MATTAIFERKRGAPLTGWLILMLLANLWTIYRYLVIIEDWLSHSDQRWQTLGVPFVALTVLGVVNIIAVLLIWRWKIIGLYLFVLVSLIAFAINLLLGLPLVTALIGLVGMVIMFALVNSKRELFS